MLYLVGILSMRFSGTFARWTEAPRNYATDRTEQEIRRVFTGGQSNDDTDQLPNGCDIPPW
jgi:hypothetical protein